MMDSELPSPNHSSSPEQQPITEKPSPVSREVLYSQFGFTIPIQEVLAGDLKTVEDINKINTSLDPVHYAEANPNETIDETREWLEETISPFDIVNFKQDSTVIAAKSEDGKELSKYVYFYPSEEKLTKILKQQYREKAILDVSYVTAESEESQSPEKIADVFSQASWMLTERSLGRSGENLTGILTSDEVTTADQKLVFLATVQSKGEENSSKALQLAGFKKVHNYLYKEDGEENSTDYTVYALSPADLAQKLKLRQSFT